MRPVPTSRRDARERRALNRGRSTHDVSETQFQARGVATRPISRWCALIQFEVTFPHKSYKVMLQKRRTASACPLSTMKRFKTMRARYC